MDYQATAEELGQHFNGCGAINRVTILCDKYTGHPKGYVPINYIKIIFVCRFAYVEFTDADSVKAAVELDESLFRGRQIKVFNYFLIVFKLSLFRLSLKELIDLECQLLVEGVVEDVGVA